MVSNQNIAFWHNSLVPITLRAAIGFRRRWNRHVTPQCSVILSAYHGSQLQILRAFIFLAACYCKNTKPIKRLVLIGLAALTRIQWGSCELRDIEIGAGYMSVITEEELAQKIKAKESTIEVEGALANTVIKIKAKGPVAWGIAIGLIGIGAGAAYVTLTPSPDPATKGLAPAVGAGAFGSVAAVLGVGGAATLFKLAKAAGGVKVLNELRSYKIVSQSDGKVILKR